MVSPKGMRSGVWEAESEDDALREDGAKCEAGARGV